MLRDIVKPTLVLFLVCLIVTAALAFTYSATEGTIEQRAKIDAENARKEVLSDAQSFDEVDIAEIINQNTEYSKVKEAYTGIKDGEVIGYVFSVSSSGYGGDVKMTVGITSEGKITGVNIGDNNETPGLGSKAKEPKFNSQFDNLTPSESLVVVKTQKTKPEEIEAISGATITSRAVTSGVEAAVEVYQKLVEGGAK